MFLQFDLRPPVANYDDFTSLCRFSGAYFSLPLSLPWADAPTCWWFLVILAIQGWVLGRVLAHSWACLVGPGPLDSVRPLLGGERRCVCVGGAFIIIFYLWSFMHMMVFTVFSLLCCCFSSRCWSRFSVFFFSPPLLLSFFFFSAPHLVHCDFELLKF